MTVITSLRLTTRKQVRRLAFIVLLNVIIFLFGPHESVARQREKPKNNPEADCLYTPKRGCLTSHEINENCRLYLTYAKD